MVKKKLDKIVVRGSSRVIRIEKKNNKVKIIDEETNKIMTTSTKLKEKELINTIISGKRKLRFSGIERFKNFDVERTNYVRRKKVGRVYLKIRFYKGKQQHTVSSDSGFTAPLVSKNERARAEAKAFERCVAQLNFYDYDKHTILQRDYLYNIKRG